MKNRLSFAVLLWVISTAGAMAFDLTGTWEGTVTCKQFNGIQETNPFFQPKVAVPATLQVSQVENDVNLFLDASGLLVALHYGFAIEDVSKPEDGQITFLNCYIKQDPDYSAVMGSAEVSNIGLSNNSKFEAVVNMWTGPQTIYTPDGVIGRCDWSFKMIDSTDPGVPDCPPAY